MRGQNKETHCSRPTRQSQRAKTEFPQNKTKNSRKKKQRPALRRTQESGSRRDSYELRLSTENSRTLLKQERVRATQWALNTSTTITDTAFLVFLGTPRCPHRVKNDLRFSHMMHRKSIGEEKQGAENYAHPKIERGNDGPKLNCSAPAPHRE